MASEGEEDTELLERARRLCLAASQLELPVLLPGFRRTIVRLEKAVSDETPPVDVKEDKLPLIAVKKRRKSLKQPQDKARREQVGKKKHEREVEKVKQAQERARARVARTNQLEHQQTLREVEQQRSEAVGAAEECAEKIRRAQESRRRANERVRIQRREKTPDTVRPEGGQYPAKLKVFHRKKIRRVQTPSQQAIHSDKIDVADSSERNEDTDADLKLMERRLRLETAARLKRMRQLAENQKRQEQEEFEQGLQKFKSKLREMDRVAKGLRKQPSTPQINEPTTCDTVEATFRQEIVTAVMDTQCPSPVPGKLVLSPTNQDEDLSSDSDGPNSPARRPAPTGLVSPRTAESDTRRSKRRSRLPAWKQPPVPLQPTQYYSYKAIIPSYSRTSVTAPGCLSAATLVSGTRFREKPQAG